ncbi:MAG: nucleotidyl transferase AbiEii/AbiGii toxin family protein [Lachnospiraceae bacterium]|nr:nucleotidyl transferase AbiEii/AbiGii toxin family protein [Lachnospiraceae bacterium]
MKLHLDENAFKQIISNVNQRTGYREDILEKDYYVTLILQELAVKQQNGLKAYFKGGTALYKALQTTRRFSEDIDLSVDVRDCTRSQSDKRLEEATKKYSGLIRDKQSGTTNRSAVISNYIYKPVVNYDAEDALQRFGKVKIEATSFTISEPVESLTVMPMIYQYATDGEKNVLKEKYDVFSFQVMTISLERAFIDKLFAAEAYTRKSAESNKAFEAAKHIYDLTVMFQLPRIKDLLSDTEQMTHLLDIRTEEEEGRLDGIPGVSPNEFRFFDEIEGNKDIQSAYNTMQRQYVLSSKDCISFEDAAKTIKDIQSQLKMCSAWTEYRLKKDPVP